MERAELKLILEREKKLYKEKVIYSNSFLLARLKNETPYKIYKWQRLSRLTDFYHEVGKSSSTFMRVVSQFLYYIRRKHQLGERLGLEIGTVNIGEGLIIYHYNNVINE